MAFKLKNREGGYISVHINYNGTEEAAGGGEREGERASLPCQQRNERGKVGEEKGLKPFQLERKGREVREAKERLCQGDVIPLLTLNNGLG